MKKHKIRKGLLVIYVLILILGAKNISCYEGKRDKSQTKTENFQNTLTDEQLINKFYRICEDLNLNVPFKGTNEKILIEKNYYAEAGLGVARLKIPDILRIKFNLNNEQVLSIINEYAGAKLGEKPLYKPLITEKEATEKAIEYLKKIGIKEGDYNLKLVKSKFYEKEGEWSFFWERYYKQYKYYQDRVDLSFGETYGIIAYGNHCLSKIPPTIEVKISEQKAKEIAAQYANDLIMSNKVDISSGKTFKNRFYGYKIGGVFSARLSIVTPNYLLSDKSTWGTDKLSLDTRLAWIISFEVNSKRMPVPGEIFLLIDANTGERLGGSFTL